MILKAINSIMEKNDNNLIQSNKERIKLIKEIDMNIVSELFYEIKIHIENNDGLNVKYILENELFFHEIKEMLISSLIKNYMVLNQENRNDYINSLINAYRLKAVNGAYYCMTPIIEKYNTSLSQVM